MKEKEKTATDESYRDLSNLPAKLQKHQVFETELKSHNDALQNLNKVSSSFLWRVNALVRKYTGLRFRLCRQCVLDSVLKVL